MSEIVTVRIDDLDLIYPILIMAWGLELGPPKPDSMIALHDLNELGCSPLY